MQCTTQGVLSYDDEELACIDNKMKKSSPEKQTTYLRKQQNVNTLMCSLKTGIRNVKIPKDLATVVMMDICYC